MLICPQCQFENPTANNFCQQCGVSLTQNTCAECGSLVAFDQLNCQECGAASGVLWWAVVTMTPSPSGVDSPPLGASGYLDWQRRYRLIEPLTSPNEQGEQQGVVLDCSPFQLSPLESLVLQSLEQNGVNLLPSESEDSSDQAILESMDVLSVPDAAKPYIALNNQFYHTLPAIHNAWQSDSQTTLLLEDRSHFPQLATLLKNDESPPPILQLLHWLYETIELWEALAPWQCQPSLLNLDNLRVDAEDQTLCLQRLYRGASDQPLPIQCLGRLWQTLFAETQTTCTEAIVQLLADLENQSITNTDDLRARLEAIAYTYQPNLPIPNPNEMTPTDMGTSDPDRAQPSVGIAASKVAASASGKLPLQNEDENTFENDEMPTIVLPMQLYSLEEVGRTDVGRQRNHNEDYFGIETHVVKLESPSGRTLHVRNLYVLCDGMGGHAGGEIASALAVDTIRKYFQDKWKNRLAPGSEALELPDVTMMTEAVLAANQAIFEVNQQNARSGSGRMGTTLVVVAIQDTEVAVAHVGDSRLYRYTRKRGLEQITVDHEVGQREIQRGVEPVVAYSRPDAYQLTQALGPRDEHFVKPDVQFFELNEDMLVLLCSDGLSDNDLLEKHWESHIQPLMSSHTNLDKGVHELIQLANQYNGHDNITAIAIRAKVRPSLEHLR